MLTQNDLQRQNSSLPPNLCWRMAIAVNNERVYFNMSNDLSAIAIIAKIEKDDDTIQSLRVPVREFQTSTHDLLSYTDNPRLFFDHLGTCYTTEGCLLIEVFFSSSHQIVNSLDKIDQLRDLFQRVLSNFTTQLVDISTTIVIFSNLAWKLHLVNKETAERAFSLLYPVNPSIPLFCINDLEIYKATSQAYVQLLELFPEFHGATGKPVRFFRPNYSNEDPKSQVHSLELLDVLPMSSKGADVTETSLDRDKLQNEVLTDLPDELSTDELFHIVDNVPYSMAPNLGRALSLKENDIDNITSQIPNRKPKVIVYDILEKAITSNLATRKHFATALLQIQYPHLAKTIDPTLKIPENVLPKSDGILLVDGDLKFYDRELAHEYLKHQYSISFWHTLHEKIASIIRSSLQSYGIQMGASFVSSFQANISLQSLHQAFQLAIDIKNNAFIAMVEKELVILGFKGKLAVLFQINEQEVTPEFCTSLYVRAIVTKYQVTPASTVPIAVGSSQTPTISSTINNEPNLQHPKAINTPIVVGSAGMFVPKVSKKAPQRLKSTSIHNKTVAYDDKNELYFFIRKSNPKAIEMINNGSTLTEPDDNGYFPIHHAAQYGNNEAIQVMLAKGINVNMLTQNSERLTPLHVAANHGQTLVVETMLAAGANIEASTSSGLTPVRLASSMNHAEVVEVLLKKGALSNAYDKDGVTSLHVAVHRGNGRVVELLLEHGANALCYDNQGITPFQLVLDSQKHALLKVFLQRNSKLLESVDHLSCFPLIEYCFNGVGDIKMIEVMLEHGANPNEVYPDREAALLHAACELDHVDLIELLIKHGADPTKCFPTIGTPLHHAILKGNIRAVQKLMELKVSPNLMNAENISPLAKAILNKEYEIAIFLIYSGADVNQMVTPKPGIVAYPIHMAVLRKHFKLLQSIVNKGCAINATDNSLNTALHLAIYHFQNDMVEFLCQKGANVNVQNIDGRTPLIYGVIKENESGVFILLEYEPDINIVDYEKISALSYAFIKGSESVVDFLLNFGADFDVPDTKGYTAFHRGCRFGSSSQIALMLSIKPNIMASHNASIDSPLLYALLNPPVLTFLLERGENPNIFVDNNGTNLPILYEAIFNGYKESTQILMAFGANPNVETIIGTALHVAVNSCHVTNELFTLLLKAGVEIMPGPDNVTPLLLAAEQNYLEKAKILLDYKAKIEIGKESNGFTPLHIAVYYNHIEMTRLLLKHTENPDATKTKDGLTPLFIAAIQENYEILNILVAKKCNIDTQDEIYGNTPLIHALQQKKLQMAQKLVSLGANINAANAHGATPLIIASVFESDFASTLIDKGADITAQTEDGITPLHIAVMQCDNPLLVKLIEKGASLKFKTSNHPSPLHYAVSNNNISALKILLSHGASVENMAELSHYTTREEIKQLINTSVPLSVQLQENIRVVKMLQLTTTAEIFKSDGKSPLDTIYKHLLNDDFTGLRKKLSGLSRSHFQDMLLVC